MKVLINKADLEEVIGWIDNKCNAPHLEVKMAIEKLSGFQEIPVQGKEDKKK